MKISVVTAVFNNAATIRDALESTLSQRYPNVELVVVDGGSTDGTQKIIEAYRDRIATYVSEPDRGIYDALNKGVRLATGDVIGFLHSDDLFADTEALSRVTEVMREPNVDACYGDLNYVRKEAPHAIVRAWAAGDFTRGKLRRGWMPPHPTLYVRREVYAGVGEFNTRYRIAADYDWMLRVLQQTERVRYVKRVQVLMRVGGASNRSLKNIIRKSTEDYRALRSNGFGAFAAVFALAGKNIGKLPQFLFARRGARARNP
ncbi:MAG: glycosyltransferase [Burkholderiales bacterium]|nr:MAG: glycosyltransferase [Burkholderiales bacterium]TAG79745.1 MAG: glycosyltransferase [Betaproteobacteria bacterium]